MRPRETLLAFLLALVARSAIAAPEALLVVAADQHSAYERTAQFVARIDRLRAEHPGVPLAILIDGDAFELGNAIARRTHGAIDFAMFAALAQRAPTVLNFGNHEPEFHEVDETIRRLRATGIQIVSANLLRPDGRAYLPATVDLRLGRHELVVAGLTTDRLATYRVAIRPTIDPREPVAAARAAFAALAGAPLPIVLSHAGLKADRQILAFTPDGALFAGAHDHLRFVHRTGRTVYFHSGSWMEFVSIARLERDERGLRWEVEQVKLSESDPADPELARLIRETFAAHLTAEETAVVGRTERALAPSEAARFAVEAARRAAHADVAVIGATTFGAGLPAGEVSRFALDACVRFDGTLFAGEVEGARLQAILARANQGPDTPFADRAGENLVASGPDRLEPARRYRLVTTDWVARNATHYLGEHPPALTEQRELKLKAAVIAALRAPAPTAPSLAESEALYEFGLQVFEQLPAEVKAQMEFPTKEQWDTFAVRLHRALASSSLDELAHYGPEARSALRALRTIGGLEDIADWLAQRLDEIEAAQQITDARTPSPSLSPLPSPTRPGTPPRSARVEPVPHFDLWVARVRSRPLPPRARELAPQLRAAFAAEGVPPELVWLAEAESSFNPAARSPVGARGLFQIMPETARELGLSTFLPDERTDPEKSARAAARHLRRLHGRFDNWALALAAYNAGEGAVRRALTARRATTFTAIADALPAETRMYVPKVCALIATRAGVPPDRIGGR